MKSKSLIYSIITSLLLAGLFYYLSFPSIIKTKSETESKIKTLENLADNDLDSIYEKLQHTDKNIFINFLSKNYANTFDKKGITYFIYENDSLQFWTDNHPAVENYMLNICLEKKIVKLKNGYYQVIRHSKNNYSSHQLYALVLIKNDYAYQNKYLKNSFNPYLNLPARYEIIENKTDSPTSFNVSNTNGDFLFSVNINRLQQDEVFSLWAFLFFNISITLILLLFRKYIKPYQSIVQYGKWLGMVSLCTLLYYLYLLRLHGLYISISSLKDDMILSPIFFICLLALITWTLWEAKNLIKKHTHIKNNRLIWFSFYIFFMYLMAYCINQLLAGRFKNPYLSSDLADVFFYPSTYIYASYLCVILTFLCFAWLCQIGYLLFFSRTDWKKHLLAFFVISIAIIVLQYLNIFNLAWACIFFALIILSEKQFQTNRFLYGIIVCLILSFFGAYLVIDLKNKADTIQRKEIAQRLLNPKDEVVENLFQGVGAGLHTDKELQKLITKKQKNSITLNPEQYILQKYFMGYWERYQVSVCLFDSLCTPLVTQTNQFYNNNTYFDDIISLNLKPTDCNGLYFDYALKDKTYYLFKQNLPFAHKPYQIYILVQSKNAVNYRGFPDLLLNQSSSSISTDYSYAIYKNNILQEKQGPYEYENYLNLNEIKKKKSFNQNSYNHFVYAPNEKTVVIISKNYSYSNDLSATVSFLFLIASMFFLIFSIFNSVILQKENSLAVKIQHYVSIGVLFLFIPVVTTSFILARKQIETQNIDAIKEKIQTVSNYLNSQLSNYDALNADDKEYVAYVLRQSSDMFKSDITLYSVNGEYFTAALSRLFDEGIISKKINPKVYSTQLASLTDKKVYDENVGKLHFYSAYSPIYNSKKKELAILNLPYFSEQNKIQAELFGYLSTLFNIYVLAFMLIVVAAALLSNWLTAPLQKLQTQIKKVTLQQNNEPIDYNKSDEIGMLISSYNSMLIKLKQSADQLSKSEREGAWKEMARQVAHEIKNPLTPMKLSIQHVERLMNINPEEANKQAKKIFPILLEQINALAHIAGEFSSFAQLPSPNMEPLDLVSFVKNCLPLYQQNQKTSIDFVSEIHQAFVMADKDHLLHVLNNLINNAIQAINENKQGTILIKLIEKNKTYIVSVTDNGIGIKEDMKPKIFQPNFSTKSYGTGLGLAICKRMIEQHNGTIWFESTEGRGTTFYIQLNSIND